VLTPHIYFAMKRKQNASGLKTNKRQRKTNARRVAVTKGMRPTNIIHKHTKHALGTIPGNAAYAPYQSVYSITLGAFNGATDLANLYDQYRIDSVTVKFFLRVDPSAQAAASAIYPKLYYARDLDDTATATIAVLQEYADCQTEVLRPDKPVVIKFVPNTVQMIARAGGGTGFSVKYGEWCDMAFSDVLHFGFKYCVDNLTNTNYTVDLVSSVEVSCKSSR